MVYSVARLPVSKRYAVTRLVSETEICRIGEFATKREAIQVARLLAGWRGRVFYDGALVAIPRC